VGDNEVGECGFAEVDCHEILYKLTDGVELDAPEAL